jgi:hypothetical protein
MGRYDDNFVQESLDIKLMQHSDDDNNTDKTKSDLQRRINRRDAARAACDALTNDALVGKAVLVWTA